MLIDVGVGLPMLLWVKVSMVRVTMVSEDFQRRVLRLGDERDAPVFIKVARQNGDCCMDGEKMTALSVHGNT
jgi:hypothetical protein